MKIQKIMRYLKPLSRKESGMVTAEYALGTVATTGIAGILIWLVQQEWFRELVSMFFKTAFSLG